MQTHRKMKIEVVVEAPILPRVIAAIDKLGAKGYTVLPSAGGRGLEGTWQEGQVSSAMHMNLVIVIADQALAERIVETVYDVIEPYTGILYTSEVSVVREAHF